MSQEAVEKILGRMITDERFRSAAEQALELSCLREGYNLTQAELNLLAGLQGRSFGELARQINPGLRRAA
jgi:hypothetical protein